MLFAHLQRLLKTDRWRLHGPIHPVDEWLLAATTQILRRMAKRLLFTGFGWRTFDRFMQVRR